MKLALIGFGDLGNYIKRMLLEFNVISEDEIVYFDDNLAAKGEKGAYPFAAYADEAHNDYNFYICLGYRHLNLKKIILARLLELGRTVPSFVHPSSYVHPTVKIGAGSFIYPGCSIDQNTIIGKGVWIANTDTIAHDCVIGDCCWFGASVTLSGQVVVGERTFIGSGTVIANALRIGSETIIGLGTVVTKEIPDNTSVIGNPMRILENKLNLK